MNKVFMVFILLVVFLSTLTASEKELKYIRSVLVIEYSWQGQYGEFPYEKATYSADEYSMYESKIVVKFLGKNHESAAKLFTKMVAKKHGCNIDEVKISRIYFYETHVFEGNFLRWYIRETVEGEIVLEQTYLRKTGYADPASVCQLEVSRSKSAIADRIELPWVVSITVYSETTGTAYDDYEYFVSGFLYKKGKKYSKEEAQEIAEKVMSYSKKKFFSKFKSQIKDVSSITSHEQIISFTAHDIPTTAEEW